MKGCYPSANFTVKRKEKETLNVERPTPKFSSHSAFNVGRSMFRVSSDCPECGKPRAPAPLRQRRFLGLLRLPRLPRRPRHPSARIARPARRRPSQLARRQSLVAGPRQQQPRHSAPARSGCRPIQPSGPPPRAKPASPATSGRNASPPYHVSMSRYDPETNNLSRINNLPSLIAEDCKKIGTIFI